MADLVRYEVRDGIAVITVDNPPVNALTPGVPEGIDAAVARAGADPAVAAAVLIGAGRTFVAGADIRFFQTIHTAEESLARSREIHGRLRRIEDCPKPVVAAIHGTALGGGMEFAMACHYRVAVPGAKIGQPEVLLGILPGAAGTQRLPRLCSVPVALELCTLGQQISAARAHGEGILDELVTGDLLEGAIRFAREKAAAGAPRRTRELPIRTASLEEAKAACDTARKSLARTARGAQAPFASVDAIEAGAELGFDSGSQREIELFARAVISPESRALVRLFFAEREAAKPPRDSTPAEIRLVGVVGAGTMGGGIAMSLANGGVPVLLKESSQEALDRGLAVIRSNYEASLAKGKIKPGDYEKRMALIQPVTDWTGFDAADLVIEAVYEDLALKKQIFRELDAVTRPGCLLASNTSTLDIDALASETSRPALVCGMHFFSPANVMKLLEIVRGAATADDTVATAVALGKKIAKVPVTVGNCFGFVGNRMLAYYLREASLLLEEGASVPQIDRAMTDFGMAIGPFGMQDIAGIDVGARIRMHLRSIGMERAEGPQSVVPDQLFEMGRYGQKTGAGYYRYEPGSRAGVTDPLIDELAAKAAADRGIERRAIADEEIIARITAALANEGANILMEGKAARPGDIDVIYAYGYSFPRHRGGPMQYADETGLGVVLERIRSYAARFGDYWKPSPLLETLAAQGKGFYDAAAPAAAGR